MKWKEPWMEEVYLSIKNGNLDKVSPMNVIIYNIE